MSRELRGLWAPDSQALLEAACRQGGLLAWEAQGGVWAHPAGSMRDGGRSPFCGAGATHHRTSGGGGCFSTLALLMLRKFYPDETEADALPPMERRHRMRPSPKSGAGKGRVFHGARLRIGGRGVSACRCLTLRKTLGLMEVDCGAAIRRRYVVSLAGPRNRNSGHQTCPKNTARCASRSSLRPCRWYGFHFPSGLADNANLLVGNALSCVSPIANCVSYC